MNKKTASPWKPTTDAQQLKVMGKTLEELGELSQVLARSIIQGIDEEIPDSKKTNRQWLEEEVADCIAMIHCLTIELKLNSVKINNRIFQKEEYFNSWKVPENEK